LKKLIVFILINMFFLSIYAQEENCPEPKKKALKIYTAAKGASTIHDKKILLMQALKIDEEYLEVYDELANMAQYKENNSIDPGEVIRSSNLKIKYWKKINEICPEYRNYFYSMQLGELYFSRKKYDLSKPYFMSVMASHKAYKRDERIANSRIEDIDAYYRLIHDTVPFEPKIVEGPSTGRDEYLPMLSPDNRYLFFTRKMPDESKSTVDAGSKELFIRSRKTMGNRFSGGIPMGAPFNLGQFQGGVSVSVNNKMLFITIVDVIPYRGKNRAGYGRMFDNADIYFSEFKDGVWTKLESIGSNINTPSTWEAQPSISSDNKTLYFTRVIDPFAPNMDIYKCERQPNGSWGDPINLGAPINTLGDEKAPFMHSDSYTLYFSSTGHMGIGGYDIFYSKMDEKTEQFNKPINIGYPINTEQDEHGFIVSRNGDKAYYGSQSEDKKDLNIFSFELYEEARPKAVSFINGEMLNNKGEVPEGVEITLKNTRTNKEVDAVIDQETGKYVAVITVDKDKKDDIMLTAKKKGFAFTSQLISANQVVIGKTVKTKKVEIKPIEVGEAYRINDIKFSTNSFEITPRIMSVLNEFIDFLTVNDNLKIAINGYTDNVGNANDNLLLSENRAKAVYDYLLLEDIEPNRLTSKGFGQANPIAKNDTEKGRAKNRRTEFVIVSK
jgi:outer membrane protein OmpA-like peptidoglycan-associated protein